jgi:hypothetical protein
VKNIVKSIFVPLLPIIIILIGEEQEPILLGPKCDMKSIYLVQYCEDDKKVVGILAKIKGPEINSEDLKLKDTPEEHKEHKLSIKLMCLKFAYGCPKCQFWARSFTQGVCKYCGGKLVKSKYWSPILVIFNEKVCLYSGIFPHIEEK